MVEMIDDIFIACPVCGIKLDVFWESYYTEDGNGDILEDSEVEYECPNGCQYTNEQIDVLSEEIGRKVWGNT